MTFSQIGDFLKAHWPAILAFGLAFWAKFGTQIQDYVTTHPNLSIAYSLVAFVVAYYLKSPFTPSVPKSSGVVK